MRHLDLSLQLIPERAHATLDGLQKLGLGGVSIGLLLLVVSVMSGSTVQAGTGFGLVVFGALAYIVQTRNDGPPGIKNNFIMFSSIMSRGYLAWMAAVFMTGFYIILYFYPQHLKPLVVLVNPLQVWLSGSSAWDANGNMSQWFLYGFIYTVTILVMGVRALIKYRHSRYQILRTLSVMFFQLAFAFTIPNVLAKFNNGLYFEWANIWPLRYYELFPYSVEGLISSGGLGKFMLFWAVFSILILTPVLTYFFGKRWYCSWVCGCGGLAETLGDPFRQNSDKSLRAWKVERWMIHSVLVLVVVTTGLMWANHLYGGEILGTWSGRFSSGYGFLIHSIFAGVIGTGFYPVMGSRVWCRFGCPMAAVLGILQRFFSRFRITTNGGQCISCGNCSTYCEMGIDVRWYAQRGENIVRASCVGCGMCSAVCPRGVLNLENGPMNNRTGFQV
ncbi:4Fe-4S binding protein [Acanthopleuribacter pedis]|uniref:4Fe-4S binding protein n=1 Tax=Acanthopleuribacter pedis TaxID=442870 RepID=A0A8J7Q3S1_9BACT|nr:4Fe-4S dicluster domain-containing protein [Acanthopleuribacter pedis]MBO1317116.1 4Fe-4S binding protein [Acanthopleuribacter pedis]